MKRRIGFLLSFLLLSLGWLPAGIVALTLARGFSLPAEAQVWLSLLPAAPAGLPLALGCLLLARAGRRRMAWAAFAVLAPITAATALFAGLLGPLGIAAYAVVVSLPAWALYARQRFRRTR